MLFKFHGGKTKADGAETVTWLFSAIDSKHARKPEDRASPSLAPNPFLLCLSFLSILQSGCSLLGTSSAVTTQRSQSVMVPLRLTATYVVVY